MRIKMFVFIIVLTTTVIFGQDCINYQVMHNCSSNQTVINADNSNISFVAHAKWNQNSIDYQIKHGQEILSMSVQADQNALLLNVNYHNKSTHLRLDPQTGHFDAENMNEFVSLLNAMDTSFIADLQEFIAQIPSNTGDPAVLTTLYEMLTNPLHPNFAIGGVIGVMDIWGPGKYAACWYGCMAGCMGAGGGFSDCGLECGNRCDHFLE